MTGPPRPIRKTTIKWKDLDIRLAKFFDRCAEPGIIPDEEFDELSKQVFFDTIYALYGLPGIVYIMKHQGEANEPTKVENIS